MGFAIENFNLFRELARAGGNDKALRALSRFSVVAVILHDPTETDFQDFLDKHFEALDRSTGEDLLFFALCRPRGFGTRTEAFRKTLDGLVLATDGVGSRSVDATALAIRLKIPPEALPVLVLTQSLSDGGFTWVKTACNSLENQLNSLGSIARHLRSGTRALDIASIRAEIDLCDMWGQVALARPLSTVIATGLAAAEEPAGNPSPLVRRAINEAWRRLASLRRDHADTLAEDMTLEREIGDIGILLAQALTSTSTATGPEQTSFVQGLEPLSDDLLRMAEKLWRILRLDAAPGAPPGRDFSPFVLCLGKALEVEVHRSVVQWARSISGIPMPTFFDRAFSHEQTVVEIEPGFQVDLTQRRNRNRQVASLPAGIGVALPLASYMRGRGAAVPAHKLQEHWDEFSKWLDAMRLARNACAHIDPVDEARALEARAVSVEGVAAGWWSGLIEVKRAMRGEGPRAVFP